MRFSRPAKIETCCAIRNELKAHVLVRSGKSLRLLRSCHDARRLRVREVEMCWQTARSTVRGETAVVDLREVDFVDDAGERLLAAMHQDGAKLLATTPMMKSLIAAIAGGPERAEESTEPRPHRGARHLKRCVSHWKESPG